MATSFSIHASAPPEARPDPPAGRLPRRMQPPAALLFPRDGRPLAIPRVRPGYDLLRRGDRRHHVCRAQAYADESVRAIAASWDASELEKRASTELKAEASHEAIVRLMKQCKARLGALRTVRQHENVLMRSGTTTAAGTFQVVSLNVAATFQKGPGEIKITLVKTGAAWQINEFRVSWPL